MKKVELTVLSKKDLETRYDNIKNMIAERLTKEAIEKGYSIGAISYDGLSEYEPSELLDNIHEAVAKNFKGCSYKIGALTDLSEARQDKVYFAFKVKECVQTAHNFCGCDSECFTDNFYK